MSTPTKLRVDLSAGIVEAEGDEKFVEKIYADFKDRLLNGDGPKRVKSGSINLDPASERAPRGGAKAKPKTKGSSEATKAYSPVLVKDLNTAKLPAFFKPYKPKNHPERILIFAKFLESELKLSPFTADQIFTCYKTVTEKVPVAFEQAFRDASGSRYGYIDYKSLKEIVVTIRGSNHFDHNGIALKS